MEFNPIIHCVCVKMVSNRIETTAQHRINPQSDKYNHFLACALHCNKDRLSFLRSLFRFSSFINRLGKVNIISSLIFPLKCARDFRYVYFPLLDRYFFFDAAQLKHVNIARFNLFTDLGILKSNFSTHIMTWSTFFSMHFINWFHSKRRLN